MTAAYDFSDRLTTALAEMDPLEGLHVGIVSRDHLAPDLSPAGIAARRESLQRWRDEADAVETSTPADRTAIAVAVAELDGLIDAIDRGDRFRDLDTIVSPWQSFRESADLIPTDEPTDLPAAAERLGAYPDALRRYRDGLAAGLAEGNVVSRRTVTEAVAQGRAAAGDDSSLRHWLDGVVEAHGTEAVAAAGLDRAVDDLRAVYAELSDWLETTYLPGATEADGVGTEHYRAAVARHLGTDLDLEATYAWGWDQLRRELAELDDICRTIDPDRTTAEVVNGIDDDPAQLAATPADFVAAVQAQQDQAIRELDGEHFDIDERLHELVVRVSPAGGSLAAQCIPAAEDWSRPGIIQWPLHGRTDIPLAREMTTAYHEGVPGHHLQCNYPRVMDQPLSRLHQSWVWLPGLGEGWALYAERFMDELGAFDDRARVGFVLSKLLRTFRVVVDLGLHLGLPIPDDAPLAPGESWTFERAVELMQQVTFESEPVVRSELMRYLSWPAQAISYKLGERAILEWRDRYVTEGGEPLPAFHRRLLEIGAVGLDLADDLLAASAP